VDNNGKGSFKKKLFRDPDFTSLRIEYSLSVQVH
jgi:hypothetical protein